MKKTIALAAALVFCLFGFQAQADEFRINGNVTFAAVGVPLADFRIYISSDDTSYVTEVTTGLSGNYEAIFDIPAGELVTFTLQTIDFCTGELLSETVDNSQGNSATVDFSICSIIDPPPPHSDCEAFFDYFQPDPSVLTLEFSDFSFSNEPIVSWDWDFGDGNIGSGPAVTHTYAFPGDYDVTLTIASDSCSATTIQPVHVSIDTSNCACPGIFDPVCVDLGGIVIPFENPCLALCAGIDSSMFVQCDSLNPCFCPGFDEPVCAIDANGDTLTFQNICFAECAGYVYENLIDCTTGLCFCPTVYDPVCVIDSLSGDTLTFGNFCFAECEGYTDVDYFHCVDSSDCVCGGVYDPVCVDIGGLLLPFENACLALCAGFDSTMLVQCDTTNCFCPNFFDPVCVIGVNGDTISFQNACFAECEGFTHTDYFACNDSTGCVCPGFYEPVCVFDPATGDTVSYDNFCLAECAGYTFDDFIPCHIDTSGCICPDIYDPVCVDIGVTGFDFVITFDNACEAICQGFDTTMFVQCDTSGCICPDFYDPVCVIDTIMGDTLTFHNFCYANCEGYAFEDFFYCGAIDSLNCWVDFIYYPNANNELEISFESHLSGVPSSYFWDFGDGNTSTQPDPTHTYASGGIYDVILTITYENGCTASWILHICIGGGGIVPTPDCQAFFFFELQDSFNLSTFNFMDMSIGDNLSYSWDFGDGGSSTEQNPTHTFANAGGYIVELTVTGDSCTSSYAMLIFTNPNGWYEEECNALFLPVFNPDSLTIAFINLSSPDAIAFEWDFGDGNTSAEPFPLYTYATEGVYDVVLTITTIDGCTNTFTMTVDLGQNSFQGRLNFNLTSTEDQELLGGVTLFPNPAGDFINIQLDAREAADGLISIIDLQGRQLQAIDQALFQGENTLRIELGDLPSGIYFARIQTADEVTSIKFAKY
ncbi:MAG: PKD domain-containing protein [Bacteroidota bacterium]